MSELNINFNEGYKEFRINDDPNRILRVNVADFNVLKRMKESQGNLQRKIKEYQNKGVQIDSMGESKQKEEEMISLIDMLNSELRKDFDEIFYEGASDVVFGRQNPLAIVGGVSIYERFMVAFARVLKPHFEEELAKSKKRTEKYRESYDRIAAEIVED